MPRHIFRQSAPLTTLLGLAILGGSAAHAGQNPYDPNGTAAQLGAGASTTTPYPTGSLEADPDDMNFYVPSPYSQTVGGQTITFTTTHELQNGVFESFDSAGFDFAPNTQLLNTFDGRTPASPYGPNGPLQIDFSSGVSAFGLQVQSAGFDTENFTLTTYNGTTLVGTYTTPTFDNTQGNGKSLFVGAQAIGGDVFTKVLISSNSSVNGVKQDTSDDFYFGPLGMQPAAVPEASSVVSLGMALTLLGGVTLLARRRAARA